MKERKQSRKRTRTNCKRIKKSKKNLKKNKKRRLMGGGLAPIINKPCKCGYLNFNMSEIGNELKLALTK